MEQGGATNSFLAMLLRGINDFPIRFLYRSIEGLLSRRNRRWLLFLGEARYCFPGRQRLIVQMVRHPI